MNFTLLRRISINKISLVLLVVVILIAGGAFHYSPWIFKVYKLSHPRWLVLSDLSFQVSNTRKTENYVDISSEKDVLPIIPRDKYLILQGCANTIKNVETMADGNFVVNLYSSRHHLPLKAILPKEFSRVFDADLRGFTFYPCGVMAREGYFLVDNLFGCSGTTYTHSALGQALSRKMAFSGVQQMTMADLYEGMASKDAALILKADDFTLSKVTKIPMENRWYAATLFQRTTNEGDETLLLMSDYKDSNHRLSRIISEPSYKLLAFFQNGEYRSMLLDSIKEAERFVSPGRQMPESFFDANFKTEEFEPIDYFCISLYYLEGGKKIPVSPAAKAMSDSIAIYKSDDNKRLAFVFLDGTGAVPCTTKYERQGNGEFKQADLPSPKSIGEK